ncbi:hypothetical protein [Marinitenerispora sediminis]|uniref:Uncharacterized protein n=1 Tax=Marinitenerispora sediminis TaxID=1931232 RepID=A0A368T1X4_9ACTN|nr:hypothetical protein [Marinitenerispora sediminis]RCV50980.1 hypothetical protein DEF23_21245 [Marinitenerispora sediminis]RCV53226.1 hypothetical protein DEF28_10815 [Marinitenerispora sediminis]RCV54379.1 hypothetical protein DEF24_19360 [Marinitenerispora sediminis]
MSHVAQAAVASGGLTLVLVAHWILARARRRGGAGGPSLPRAAALVEQRERLDQRAVLLAGDLGRVLARAAAVGEAVAAHGSGRGDPALVQVRDAARWTARSDAARTGDGTGDGHVAES